MTGADSGAGSGLTAESVGSTETDVSSVSVLASACGASSASTDGFASMGVDAMVVMPAVACQARVPSRVALALMV